MQSRTFEQKACPAVLDPEPPRTEGRRDDRKPDCDELAHLDVGAGTAAYRVDRGVSGGEVGLDNRDLPGGGETRQAYGAGTTFPTTRMWRRACRRRSPRSRANARRKSKASRLGPQRLAVNRSSAHVVRDSNACRAGARERRFPGIAERLCRLERRRPRRRGCSPRRRLGPRHSRRREGRSCWRRTSSTRRTAERYQWSGRCFGSRRWCSTLCVLRTRRHRLAETTPKTGWTNGKSATTVSHQETFSRRSRGSSLPRVAARRRRIRRQPERRQPKRLTSVPRDKPQSAPVDVLHAAFGPDLHRRGSSLQVVGPSAREGVDEDLSIATPQGVDQRVAAEVSPLFSEDGSGVLTGTGLGHGPRTGPSGLTAETHMEWVRHHATST